MDRIMDPVKEIQNSGVKVQGVQLNSLTLADDIDLFEDSNNRLEVKWQNHVTNKNVRSQMQCDGTVLDTIRRRKLQLFGSYL